MMQKTQTQGQLMKQTRRSDLAALQEGKMAARYMKDLAAKKTETKVDKSPGYFNPLESALKSANNNVDTVRDKLIKTVKNLEKKKPGPVDHDQAAKIPEVQQLSVRPSMLKVKKLSAATLDGHTDLTCLTCCA